MLSSFPASPSPALPVNGEGVSPRFLGAAVSPGPNDGRAIMSCCGGSPLLIPPRAGERKGAVMLSEAKHLKSRPTKTPRSHPTTCLTQRFSPARRGGSRTAPAALSLRMTGDRMLVSLLCASCWSRQACKLRTHVNRLSAVSSPPAVTPSVNPLSLTANLYFSV